MHLTNTGLILNVFCYIASLVDFANSADNGGEVQNCAENEVAFGCKGRGEVIVMRGAWLHDSLLRVPAGKCHIPEYNVQFKKESLLSYFNKKCGLRRSCYFNVWTDVTGSADHEEKWKGHVIRVVYQCVKENLFVSGCNSNLDTPEGYLKSIAYPKYYLGPNSCTHIIKADQGQKIKVDFIDLSMRDILRPTETECSDYVSISEGNKKQIWCGDLDKPISYTSKGHILNLTMHTTSNVFPKRGFAASYTTVGCRNPVIPKNVQLVDRDAEFAEFRCQSRHVFRETKKQAILLRCVNEKFWDKDLLDCEDIDVLYQNGSLTYVEYVHFNDTSTPSVLNILEHDVAYDIIIPGVIMMALILGNIVIILLIFLYRSKVSTKEETEELESIKFNAEPVDVGALPPSQV